MHPKKKQKLIKGQSFISFGQPNEQTEDKVNKSDPGPSTQTATESARQKLSESSCHTLCVEIQCTSVYVDQV